MQGHTIMEYHGKSNNLGMLKWIAAILVIYSHCFSVTGNGNDPLDIVSHGQISFGGLAVAVFFFASGFYVTKSLLTRNSGKDYWISRLVRIYPAFITVLAVTTFILGPVVTSLSVTTYFQSSETYRYLLYIFMVPQYYLPGVFESNPVSGIVNGPLWTMVLEMICYIGIFLAWKLKLTNKKVFTWISVLIGILSVVIFLVRPGVIYTYHIYLRPFFVFMVGMIYYIFQDKIVLHMKTLFIILVLSVMFVAFGYCDFAVVIFLPYILSVFIFNKIQIPERLGQLGNYSYFMYLVAYPIQQTLVHFNPGMGAMVNCLFSILLSMIIGIAGYYLIEKPTVKYVGRLKRGNK